jgi:ubiquinone/menaquinone biosynthesis C-methylase UbiE
MLQNPKTNRLSQDRRKQPSTSSDNRQSKTSTSTGWYDAIAPTYDFDRFESQSGRYDLEEGRAIVRELVSQLLPGTSAGADALDLACGTGKVAIQLAQICDQVVGVDASQLMLQKCRSNAERAGVSDKLVLIPADAEYLPFSDDFFDIAFSFRFFHLFSSERHRLFLQELVRVVKPNGYIVVEFGGHWFKTLIFPLLRSFSKRRREMGTSPSERQLDYLAREVGGVKLVFTRGCLLPKGGYLLERPRLARIARWLIRRPLKVLSEMTVAVYQKV